MDFRLKVFQTVAELQSFTKAAKMLSLSQPAVSKHIAELEKKYNHSLFIRNNGRVQLTPEGNYLLSKTKQILQLFAETEEHFFSNQHNLPKEICLGASSSIAQYILPKSLPKLKKLYPETHFLLKSGNTDEIENLVIEQKIPFGLIEGTHRNPSLQYERFLKDEIVLVCNSNTQTNDSIKLKTLLKLPLVLREQGSGTRAIIENHLRENNIFLKDLQVDAVLNNSESIKTYLNHSDSFAFISIHAILDDLKGGNLKIVDIASFSMERYFYFTTLKGHYSPNYTTLKRFFSKNI
ncbi:DNA-binding transcriptional LysR family regulator [Balneicella halophila]|uniref:DNA-binding transcriptional LysR family regulator n=1 Tax=Balneicella halophila TaxID=1537566 RepID=A0A7L4UNU8_BALHA|nr:LysR family transcriptional regulator [Balneicella halophila]PVX49967.1 DNA-binding transcriptional LysR family regulator [Balneicella halophila]